MAVAVGIGACIGYYRGVEEVKFDCGIYGEYATPWEDATRECWFEYDIYFNDTADYVEEYSL